MKKDLLLFAVALVVTADEAKERAKRWRVHVRNVSDMLWVKYDDAVNRILDGLEKHKIIRSVNYSSNGD